MSSFSPSLGVFVKIGMNQLAENTSVAGWQSEREKKKKTETEVELARGQKVNVLDEEAFIQVLLQELNQSLRRILPR